MSLYRGGEEVAKVFALDRAAGVAQVFLMSGRYLNVRLCEVNGTRRHRPVSDELVREEFEFRAGVSFNEWPEVA